MPKENETTGETLTTGAITTSDAQKAVSGVMVAGVEYEVVAAVNVPTLKHETGQTVAVRIEGPIMVKQNAEGKDLSVCRLTELSTGGLFTYPLNAISAANLIDAYPDEGYIGKSFAIKKGGTVAGKRYKDIQIVEITPKA